jgi:hypothetical protein
MSHEDDVRKVLKGHSISMSVAERAAWDPQYAAYIQDTCSAIKPLLDDLATVGYKVEWISELRKEQSWEAAIPVLLHWLPLVKHRNIEMDIIRCLSVPWTGRRATEYLIESFRNNAESDPQYAWTIGNALAIVDVNGFEREIIKLCRNAQYGMSRQMLVMALDHLDHPEAEETALDLLDDENVRIHAIIALGKMKSKRSLFHLEKLLTDKQASIRKEARRAITKIMR